MRGVKPFPKIAGEVRIAVHVVKNLTK